METAIQHPVLKANIANVYSQIIQESKTAQQLFQCNTLPFQRIGIVGFGLMGGSIYKALKIKDRAVNIAIYDQDSGDLGTWMQDLELIILASPISTIIPLAEQIKRLCKHPLVVMDIASVKDDITQAFETLSEGPLECISTHPMAGRENGAWKKREVRSL